MKDNVDPFDFDVLQERFRNDPVLLEKFNIYSNLSIEEQKEFELVYYINEDLYDIVIVNKKTDDKVILDSEDKKHINNSKKNVVDGSINVSPFTKLKQAKSKHAATPKRRSAKLFSAKFNSSVQHKSSNNADEGEYLQTTTSNSPQENFFRRK